MVRCSDSQIHHCPELVYIASSEECSNYQVTHYSIHYHYKQSVLINDRAPKNNIQQHVCQDNSPNGQSQMNVLVRASRVKVEF